jgi:hypothetical protein
MPFTDSGYDVYEMLLESGTGKEKLRVMLSWFKRDRKGNIVEDITADEFLELVDEADELLIPPTTKNKARSFYERGEYEFEYVSLEEDLTKYKPLFERATKRVKPVKKKKKDADAELEPVAAE